MLNDAYSQGARIICSTSHYYKNHETILDFLKRRNQKLHFLTEPAKDLKMHIVPGAEVTFFDGISETKDLKLLTLGQTKTLLLEMPFSDWKEYQVQEVISLVLDHGYNVILAHPERFLFSKCNREYLDRFAEMRIGFQVNASSLLSWSTRKKALDLLESSRYPLLGSDMHNISSRPCKLEAARKVIEKKLSPEFLNFMDQNALKMLEGAITINEVEIK
jgi:protein-tyrosine phosphatase